MANSETSAGNDVSRSILTALVRACEVDSEFLLAVHQAAMDPAKHHLFTLLIGCTSSGWLERMTQVAHTECAGRVAHCAELARLMGFDRLECGRTVEQFDKGGKPKA